ncbi:hypothetical protein SCARD494_10760 [Seiridium cardinale]
MSHTSNSASGAKSSRESRKQKSKKPRPTSSTAVHRSSIPSQTQDTQYTTSYGTTDAHGHQYTLAERLDVDQDLLGIGSQFN